MRSREWDCLFVSKLVRGIDQSGLELGGQKGGCGLWFVILVPFRIAFESFYPFHHITISYTTLYSTICRIQWDPAFIILDQYSQMYLFSLHSHSGVVLLAQTKSSFFPFSPFHFSSLEMFPPFSRMFPNSSLFNKIR
eukprot:Sdes_comp16492_c0_seq1m5812